MKSITYLIKSSGINPLFDRPLPKVFLSGANEFWNYFSSYIQGKLNTGSNDTGIIQSIALDWQTGLVGIPNIAGNTITWTVDTKAGVQAFQTFIKTQSVEERTAYQLMLDFASIRPELKTVRLTYLRDTSAVAVNLMESVGNIYFGRKKILQGNIQDTFKSVSIRDFIERNNFSLGEGDPQIYIDRIVRGADFQFPNLTVDVPINIHLDEYTVLGIDGPCVDDITLMATLIFK